MIAKRVEQMADAGVEIFCCGMARGCDLYFAEAVLRLKKQRPGLRLEAWIPCPSQADAWPETDRIRREKLLNSCDKVYIVERFYSDGCMLRRDRAMVDQADILLTVWDGSSGGTAWTVSYAKRQGKRLEALWL